MRRVVSKFISVNHGTYPFDVIIAVNKTDEEVIAHVSKLVDLTQEEKDLMCCRGDGRSLMLPGGQTVVQVRAHHMIKLHWVTAHELFHAVEFLFDRIGFKYSIDTGEAFAYQIQHLTGQFYQQYYEKT